MRNLKSHDAIGRRTKWHEFVNTRTYIAVQALLALAGYHLVVVFDSQNSATDVFIEKPLSSTSNRSDAIARRR